MYTMGDAVREHAEQVKNGSNTTEALKFLELEDKSENRAAANLYLVALSIINKLENKIKELENKK